MTGRWMRLFFCSVAVIASGGSDASDRDMLHLRVLRDAYRQFSQPLPTGEMRASVYSPGHGRTHDVYAVWSGDNEYVEIRDYGVVNQAATSTRKADVNAQPRILKSLVGPEGTMLLHETPGANSTTVVNRTRYDRKPMLNGTARIVPEPHIAWYQMTWGGQSKWSGLLDRMASGELDVSVSAISAQASNVQLQIHNHASDWDWQLTYAPDKGGRIISYGPLNAEPTTRYKWAADQAGRWFLREYRHHSVKSQSAVEVSGDPWMLRVHDFSYEPNIAPDRFRFASLPLKDGTIVYEKGAKPGTLKESIVGRDSARSGALSLDDLFLLSRQLQRSGFARAPHER